MSSTEIYISNYYRNLNAYLHGMGKDPGNFVPRTASNQLYSQPVTVNPSIPDAYQWIHRRLERIVKQEQSLLQNIIVQGSYGDFTNNNYSDLDIILYLEQSVVENRKERRQLRRVIQKKLLPFIYSIDPLQHHGVFLLWPKLCNCYVQSILPLVVYSKAWSVRKFEAGFRCTAQNTPSRTPSLIQTILKESKSLGVPINFFYVKRLTSHIMMVPCLNFTDLGIYLHKASSFEPFIQKYPKTEQLLADVTAIRNRWPQKPLPVFLMSLFNIGYHMFGKRYPQVCGFLYRSKWIQERVHRLNFSALSEIVTLEKNAIS